MYWATGAVFDARPMKVATVNIGLGVILSKASDRPLNRAAYWDWTMPSSQSMSMPSKPLDCMKLTRLVRKFGSGPLLVAEVNWPPAPPPPTQMMALTLCAWAAEVNALALVADRPLRLPAPTPLMENQARWV